MEKVLVFKESVLEPFRRNFKNGVCFDQNVIGEFLSELFKPDNLFYTDRTPAETNPELKQVIPYVTVWRNAGLFVYERGSKGGEARLHNKLSVGIGGHINPIDGTGQAGYESALWRELEEETQLKKQKNFNLFESVRGLIYDDTNEVGKVHFGIIHYVDLKTSETLYFPDQSLIPVGFMTDDELSKNMNNFENWSKLTLSQFMEVK